jgi:hypothetical protein
LEACSTCYTKEGIVFSDRGVSDGSPIEPECPQ